MKATKFLKRQHAEVRELFEQLEHASGRSEKARLFQELASKLVGHDAIERQIFYPACEEAMGMTSELGEAFVEHGLVEFCLYQADEAARSDAVSDEEFEFKCTVLREIVEHHVKEEEEEFFPKVERAMGAEKLDGLTVELEDLFAEQLENDFRVGLYANLQQVMAGIMKTSPPDGEDEEDEESSAAVKTKTAPAKTKTAVKKAPAASENSSKKRAKRSA